jgi:hypothetical protein
MALRSTELPRSSAARVLDWSRRRGQRRVKLCPAGSGRVIATLVAGSALALAPVAQAETTTYRINETTPADAALTSCTGEPVVLTGTQHVEGNVRITVDLSGSRFHSQELQKFSLRGTGVDSGAVYQNQQELMTEHNGSFTVDPFGDGSARSEETGVTNMVLIRQGESERVDDLYVRMRYHMTFSASGVVTIRPPTFEVICK